MNKSKRKKLPLQKLMLLTCAMVFSLGMTAFARYIDWTYYKGDIRVPSNNILNTSYFWEDMCNTGSRGEDAAIVFYRSINDIYNSQIVVPAPGVRGGFISYSLANSITNHGRNSNGRPTWTAYFNNVRVPDGATIAIMTQECDDWWHVRGGDYYRLIWPVNTYFNANGGRFSNGSTSLTLSGYTDQSTTAQTPTRSGYKFMGWSTNSSASSGSTSVSYVSGRTYYAVWKQDTVNISFNPNGGSGSTSTFALKPGSSYTPATPTRTGYNFSGWYTAASGGSKWNNVVPTSAATYYAHWNPITYQITYSDIGENYTGPTSYTIESAEISLPKPAKTDYEFLGFTGSNGSTPAYPVSIPKGSTGDKTYTANWKALPPIINEQPKGMTAIEYTGLTEAQYLKQHNDGNRLVYPYGEIELSVKATGGSSNGITNVYQWEYTINGTDWTEIKNSTDIYTVDQNDSTLSLSNVKRDLNRAKFRCKISNKSNQSATSKEATVIVYYLPTIE